MLYDEFYGYIDIPKIMVVCVVAKIEIQEVESIDYALFIDGAGPYGFLEYARSHLADWNKKGYSEAILNLYRKYDVKKLSDVPVENYVEFLEELLNFNPKKLRVSVWSSVFCYQSCWRKIIRNMMSISVFVVGVAIIVGKRLRFLGVSVLK